MPRHSLRGTPPQASQPCSAGIMEALHYYSSVPRLPDLPPQARIRHLAAAATAVLESHPATAEALFDDAGSYAYASIGDGAADCAPASAGEAGSTAVQAAWVVAASPLLRDVFADNAVIITSTGKVLRLDEAPMLPALDAACGANASSIANGTDGPRGVGNGAVAGSAAANSAGQPAAAPPRLLAWADDPQVERLREVPADDVSEVKDDVDGEPWLLRFAVWRLAPDGNRDLSGRCAVGSYASVIAVTID